MPHINSGHINNQDILRIKGYRIDLRLEINTWVFANLIPIILFDFKSYNHIIIVIYHYESQDLSMAVSVRKALPHLFPSPQHEWDRYKEKITKHCTNYMRWYNTVGVHRHKLWVQVPEPIGSSNNWSLGIAL